MKDTTPTKVELLQHIQELQDMLAEAQRGAEPVAEITEGVRLISIERNRQIASELWTAMHDAEHDAGELAAAGAAYAINAADQLHPYSQGDGNNKQPAIWPWADGWWKPKNPQRDLARAGALIAAELDRLYAAPQRTAQGQDCNNRQKQNAVDPAPAAATPRTDDPVSFCLDRYAKLERENAELRTALDFKNRQSLQMADALEAEKKAREKWRDAAYGMAREKGEAVTDWLNEKKRAEQAEARVRELEKK